MEDKVLENLKGIINSIIKETEKKNKADTETMLDYGMNYSYYEGLIEGRNDTIKLIKKVFKYEV